MKSTTTQPHPPPNPSSTPIRDALAAFVHACEEGGETLHEVYVRACEALGREAREVE